jgi:hypothetical protein
MTQMRERARVLFPSVLLTLLSMVQALALELMWTKVREADFLWAGGWPATLGWAQVCVMGLSILMVWLFQVNMVLRFEWVPSTRDSVLPFVIGALEFTLIDMIGPSYVGLWLIGFGLVFAVCLWMSQSIFKAARRESINDPFFSQIGSATWRDFLPDMLSIGVIWIIGIAVLVTSSQGPLALIGVLLTGGLICQQLVITREFWNRSMHADENEEDA